MRLFAPVASGNKNEVSLDEEEDGKKKKKKKKKKHHGHGEILQLDPEQQV
jgi:hypothetical protein